LRIGGKQVQVLPKFAHKVKRDKLSLFTFQLVAVEDGFKRIDEIEVGDYVWAHHVETAYQDKSGYWWAKDLANHGGQGGQGGSAYKVYKKVGKELHWVADADEYGNFILDKYKGEIGRVIKL